MVSVSIHSSLCFVSTFEDVCVESCGRKGGPRGWGLIELGSIEAFSDLGERHTHASIWHFFCSLESTVELCEEFAAFVMAVCVETK